MTAGSPERAAYETAARLFESGVIGVPVIPWEELDAGERAGWARIRQAGPGAGDGGG